MGGGEGGEGVFFASPICCLLKSQTTLTRIGIDCKVYQNVKYIRSRTKRMNPEEVHVNFARCTM